MPTSTSLKALELRPRAAIGPLIRQPCVLLRGDSDRVALEADCCRTVVQRRTARQPLAHIEGGRLSAGIIVLLRHHPKGGQLNRMMSKLLATLSDDERDRVLRAARPRLFAKGEVVFHEGDPGESVHLLKSGRLAVRVSTSSGDTATLSVLSPGDAFGELALLNASHERTATVVALEPSQTLALSRADFTALRRQYPGVEHLLVQLLARRVEDLSSSLLEALYVGVDRRVNRRLLELADTYRGSAQGSVTIPITQDDLAGMAGATRPTVNQVLQRLAATNTVALGRGRIEVLDVEALRRRIAR